MDILKELQEELHSEYEITKKFMKHYPEDKYAWKPHDKSMSMKTLAVHVVEIFSWPHIIMNTDYLDFEKTPYTQPDIKSRAALQEKLEEEYKKGSKTLRDITPDQLDGKWDIRQGKMVFQEWSKYGAIRHSLNQITHHRAQLGVFYRLNNIFVPASYGPSADEQ